jgi:hypothetical protein
MRLAGGVADREARALAPCRVDAGPHGPTESHGLRAARAGERDAHAAAARDKAGLHGVAASATAAAARHSRNVSRRMQQASVRIPPSARPCRRSRRGTRARQQAGLEMRSAEIRFERDEIARARSLVALAPRLRFPRSVRGDQHGASMQLGVASIRVSRHR